VLEAGVEDIFDPAEFGAPDFAHLDGIPLPAVAARKVAARKVAARKVAGQSAVPSRDRRKRLLLVTLDSPSLTWTIPGTALDSVRNEYDVLQNLELRSAMDRGTPEPELFRE
jgi:hypothetical protein